MGVFFFFFVGVGRSEGWGVCERGEVFLFFPWLSFVEKKNDASSVMDG